MSKEAASRTLDYAIDSQILDRVKRAEKPIGLEDLATTRGELLTGAGTMVNQKGKTLQAGEAAWDVGFSKMGDRGQWASGQLYDEFQTMEAGYKEEYVKAIATGNTAGAARMLQDQAQRAKSLQGWTDVMQQAKEVNDGVGWSASLSPENKAILSALASNDGSAKLVMTPDGEMGFEINGRVVTKREVDEMVASGIAPTARSNKWFETLDSDEMRGYQGLSFNQAKAANEALSQINKNNIAGYIDDSWAGSTSFKEDFLNGDHDFGLRDDGGADRDLQAGELVYPLSEANEQLADKDGNGTVTAEEILAFFRTPEGYEAGRREIAAYMAAKRFQVWTNGHNAYVTKKSLALDEKKNN
jgi:hypothetical protein